VSNALVTWSLLFVIAVALSYAAHKVIREFVLACIAAAALAAAAFQAIAFLQLGYLDKFWPIAAVTTFLVSALVAGVVGFLVRKRARRANTVRD
jgi:hypothetical protein